MPTVTDNQNGEGTFIRKIDIIARAMISLASMAPMFPRKLPHPARPANHSFARDDFTDDRADHRTNEQANQAKEQSD